MGADQDRTVQLLAMALAIFGKPEYAKKGRIALSLFPQDIPWRSGLFGMAM